MIKRRGFGIVTAIIIMTLIAIIGAIIVSVTTMSSKKATDDYLHTQAEMLARSATEFAILRIQGFKRVNNCLESINITAVPFDINTTINYLMTSDTGCNNEFAKNVQDLDLNGMAIIDVVVTEQVTDPNNPSREPIRIHKRTLQKP
ncbi:MAG: type II secretion system protein [Campylobacterales bacterium]|nr:type II secretion system protein [Campylobacterales bacterium]